MTSLPTTTRSWTLTHRPAGAPTLTGPTPTFTLTTTPIPALEPNQLLVRTTHFSNDPAQRQWLSTTVAPARLYLPPVALNAPVTSGLLGEVLASRAEGVAVGDVVATIAGGAWSEYAVLEAGACSVVPPQAVSGVPTTTFLGALGLSGLTAWYGIKIVAAAAKGETVVVSGAAGAVGGMVVQVAKRVLGCGRVVGIAGGAEKCRWVVEGLGADACVDYKSGGFAGELERATEGGVDVYFDNVGGEVLDEVLTRMKMHGRVAVCGSMATYNRYGEGTRLRNWFEVVSMRLRLTGFVLLDWIPKIPETIEEMMQAAQEGRIELGGETEMVVQTKFEDVPKTWMRLFEGDCRGKLISQLC